MSKLQLGQKKDYAKTLFFANREITNKELSERTGATEKTIAKWIEEGNWKTLRDFTILTREEQIVRLVGELKELNDSIQLKNEGQRFADSKTADVRRKLIRDIKELENKAPIPMMVDTGMQFIDFVKQVDLDEGKRIGQLFDAFIKSKL
jgi:hypothetical protein